MRPSLPLVGALSRALAAALGLAAPVMAQIVFQSPTILPITLTTQGAVTADVDLDGNMDLVSVPAYANVFSDSVFSVLLGHGDGTFAAPIATSVPGDAAGRGAVAFMNGDAFPDFVWVLRESTPLAYSAVSICLGAGNGSFPTQQPAALLTGANYQDVVPLDLTGDGKLDLVVVDAGPFLSPGKLRSFVANAGTGFTEIAAVTLGTGPDQIELGDVNGDALPDAVITTVAGKLHVAPGLPGGGFSAASTQTVASAITGLVLRDLNGDGPLDVAVSHSGGMITLLGDGLGHFTLKQSLALTGSPKALVAGALDADAVPDLLVSRNALDDVAVLRGAGDGSFSFVTAVSHVEDAAGLALADFDADGRLDAAVGELSNQVSSHVAVLRNASYPAGSPFTDLGHPLPGSNGYPIQLADGTLLAGSPVSFALTNGRPFATSTLVVGLSQADLPFKGGVMVPAPDVLLGGLPLDATGAVTMVGLWPPGVPSGFSFYTQFWFADPPAPTHVAASTGLRGLTP